MIYFVAMHHGVFVAVMDDGSIQLLITKKKSGIENVYGRYEEGNNPLK